MREVFDLVQEICERLVEFFELTGQEPRVVVLSPASYRRLVELKSVAPEAVNPFSHFVLAIDEVLADTEVQVEP